MCGILGALCPEYSNLNFDRIISELQHRGPDSQSVKSLEGNVTLAHTRLSIIDLSDSGIQPMSNEDDTLWLTFNGEIYNYPVLKKELEKLGHIFKSKSDSEVLLHAYEEWGTELLQHISGMFAFGIYDTQSETFFLARDRMGIKPLHYFFDKKNFLFSSELKTFYDFPFFKKDINVSALRDYLMYYTIPAPKTIWKNTYKLLPGHYLIKKKNEAPIIKSYWELKPDNKKVGHLEAVEKFHDFFDKSVHEHLLSDVPVGVFLSSGYDSSALLAYSKKYLDNVNTYSIGFKDSKKTEHVEAARIAKILGSNHHELVLDHDYLNVIEEMYDFYDEPYAISSMVSYYYVSKLASEHNKVVLAGDGGDEILGGYRWYRAISNAYTRRSIFKKLFQSDIDSLRSFYQTEYFRHMGTDTQWVNELLKPEINQTIEDENPFWCYELEEDYWKLDPVKVFQLLDFKRFLPDVALPRADRSSMAHSLEVRVPFLDHEMAEFLMALDPSVYYSEKVKKPLLHENLKKYLPNDILNLPKRGFGNPLDPFYDQKDKIIEEILDGPVFESGYFSKPKSLAQSSKGQLWLLYNLHLWWLKWN